MIKIIDCGSQLTQNIARRIRENEVYTEIAPYKKSLEDILKGAPAGLIQSGGQFSVYDDSSPLPDKRIYEQNIPILGICYGMQAIAYFLGGEVKPTKNREYGKTRVKLKKSRLFEGIEKDEIITWMSHGDIVEKVPDGFEVIAVSENGNIAAMQKGNIYAVQFHPEVDHTEYGRQILANFIGICNAEKDWKKEDLIPNIINQIQEKVGESNVICAVSGGVDSMTLALLMKRFLGDRFYAVTINNGLLRKDEEKEVLGNLARAGLRFMYVDAQERFLKRLEGITDPDEKRKIIGNEFIYVLEEQASGLKDVKYLAQGTLYPDVIESVPIYGVSSKIKRHHNVGGLPEDMSLKLIEPFREMFKDEVRVISEKLELPKDIIWRHPFPGPGLAVRIKEEVTKHKLDLVREADYIFISELKNNGLYYKIKQAFAALSSDRTIGVMGDEGTYQYACILRAVVTNDFMTADSFYFSEDFERKVTNRIVNEIKGINRVYWDKTQKPPATIELE